MPELAPDPELIAQADEATVLHSFLDYYRSVYLRKAEGLTDQQARTTIEPSGLTVLGLVRHMAEVERGWFRRRTGGDLSAEFIYCDDSDPDRDFHPADDDTLADAVQTLLSEIEASRAATAGVGPADLMKGVPPQQRIPGWQPNLRWVMVHMIEEYARHAGHLDLLRERIDGATGD